MRLEKEQAEKVQENRLLMLKYKNVQSSNDNRSMHSLPASRDSQFNSALHLPGHTRGLASDMKGQYTSARGSASRLAPIDKTYGLNTIEQPRSNSVLNKHAMKNQRELQNNRKASLPPDVRIRSKSNLRSRSPRGENRAIKKPVVQNAYGSIMDQANSNTSHRIPMK